MERVKEVFERVFNRNSAPAFDTTEQFFQNVPGVEQTADTVSFLGVELQKGSGGDNVPKIIRFKQNVLTEFDLKLMQKIAVALELNQPILIESGSGLGKSETVERMCALLNRECYYANCHDFEPDVLMGSKTTREDTKSGFGWKDGIVIQAIRNGGVLFLDEYNFMRGETRGRLHEILDAILRGKDEVVLIENDGERVRVHPNFRIVASQNPPGGEFSDREILDPAQLSRYVYMKEMSDMTRELKTARLMGALRQEAANLSEEMYLRNDKSISREDLFLLPKIDLVLTQFIEFEDGLSKLIREGDLGADQPQPIFLSFQRDANRVIQFLTRFYNGDLEATMKRALGYYYANKFESEVERAKVNELIEYTVDLSEHRTRRVPLRVVAKESDDEDVIYMH